MNKKLVTIGMTIGVLVLAGCGNHDRGGGHDADQSEPAHDEMEPVEIVVQLEPKSDSTVSGTATFTAEADGTIGLAIEIAGAPPGGHAFHLHEVGDCSAADGTSAGGHWNPTGHDHGQWGSEGAYHLGDVGNIEVGEDGSGHFHMTSTVWSIGTGAENDIVGRAVILHAGVDDFTTQPTGAAGGRIACGVIQ